MMTMTASMDTEDYTLTLSPLDTDVADAARQKSLDRIKEYKAIQRRVVNTSAKSTVFLTETSQTTSIDNEEGDETYDVELEEAECASLTEDTEESHSSDFAPFVTEEEAIEMRTIIIDLTHRLEDMEKLQAKNVSELQVCFTFTFSKIYQTHQCFCMICTEPR